MVYSHEVYAYRMDLILYIRIAIVVRKMLKTRMKQKILHLRLPIKLSQFFINFKMLVIFQMHTLMLTPVTSSVVEGKNASANSGIDFASNKKYAIDVVNVCIRNRKVNTIFQLNQRFWLCSMLDGHMPTVLKISRVD